MYIDRRKAEGSTLKSKCGRQLSATEHIRTSTLAARLPDVDFAANCKPRTVKAKAVLSFPALLVALRIRPVHSVADAPTNRSHNSHDRGIGRASEHIEGQQATEAELQH